MSKPTILDSDLPTLEFLKNHLLVRKANAEFVRKPDDRFATAVALIDRIAAHHANTTTRRERRKAGKG